MVFLLNINKGMNVFMFFSHLKFIVQLFGTQNEVELSSTMVVACHQFFY